MQLSGHDFEFTQLSDSNSGKFSFVFRNFLVVYESFPNGEYPVTVFRSQNEKFDTVCHQVDTVERALDWIILNKMRLLYKEDLLNTSQYKFRKNAKGILTLKEAEEYFLKYSTITEISNNECFFYTDLYTIGVNAVRFKELHFTPSSTVLPIKIAKRPNLKFNVVNSISTYEKVFTEGKKRIETFEELLKIINGKNNEE